MPTTSTPKSSPKSAFCRRWVWMGSEVISEAEEGRMRFWVRDNGVGFDSTGSKAVFGAVKRMHRADQFEGSGIGLAIVQRVINKHGGDVWADSTVGKGTTITVQLPDNAPEQRQLLFAS